MRIRCPKCGHEWESGKERVGVRDECPDCAAFIHACVVCGHYDAGTRSCTMPNTDSVRDRESQNFCEEFEYDPSAASGGPRGRGSAAEDARKRFDNLFRD